MVSRTNTEDINENKAHLQYEVLKHLESLLQSQQKQKQQTVILINNYYCGGSHLPLPQSVSLFPQQPTFVLPLLSDSPICDKGPVGMGMDGQDQNPFPFQNQESSCSDNWSSSQSIGSPQFGNYGIGTNPGTSFPINAPYTTTITPITTSSQYFPTSTASGGFVPQSHGQWTQPMEASNISFPFEGMSQSQTPLSSFLQEQQQLYSGTFYNIDEYLEAATTIQSQAASAAAVAVAEVSSTSSPTQTPMEATPSTSSTFVDGLSSRVVRSSRIPTAFVIDGVSINKKIWAKAVMQRHDIILTAQALFDKLFTDDEILKSTLSGRNSMQKLDSMKLRAIEKAATWISNCNGNPYNFDPTLSIEVSPANAKTISDKVFVDRRNDKKRQILKKRAKEGYQNPQTPTSP